MKKFLIITFLIAVAAVFKRVVGKSNENYFVIPHSDENHLEILKQISRRVTA